MVFHLAELSESIFATLDVPGLVDRLEIGPSPRRKECLLLIDGLGNDALARYADQFPIFQNLVSHGPLQSHFPTTTVTNLTSLGTGVFPGVHGMLGYSIRVPHSGTPGRVLNGLSWDERVDPVIWQSTTTLFERAHSSGIHVMHVAAKRYEGSGFTRAALRGATYAGANIEADLVNRTLHGLTKEGSFVYLYVNMVDAAGHTDGVGSTTWLSAMENVATLIESLLRQFPQGARLWVTADHGMINVGEKIVLGKDNPLLEAVTVIAGEPRARHMYVQEGAVDDVVGKWREFLGEKVEIFTKTQAIDNHLFGAEVSEASYERMGDFIAIARGEMILIDPEREKPESSMVGHHGGLSAIEREIPLLSHVIAE